MRRSADNSISTNVQVAQILAELVRLQLQQTNLLSRLRSINYEAALEEQRGLDNEERRREREVHGTGPSRGQREEEEVQGQPVIRTGDFVRFRHPTPGLADHGRVTRIDNGMYVVESRAGLTVLTSLENLILDTITQENQS